MPQIESNFFFEGHLVLTKFFFEGGILNFMHPKCQEWGVISNILVILNFAAVIYLIKTITYINSN